MNILNFYVNNDRKLLGVLNPYKPIATVPECWIVVLEFSAPSIIQTISSDIYWRVCDIILCDIQPLFDFIFDDHVVSSDIATNLLKLDQSQILERRCSQVHKQHLIIGYFTSVTGKIFFLCMCYQ